MYKIYNWNTCMCLCRMLSVWMAWGTMIDYYNDDDNDDI